jgi:hypothetical protein
MRRLVVGRAAGDVTPKPAGAPRSACRRAPLHFAEQWVSKASGSRDRIRLLVDA